MLELASDPPGTLHLNYSIPSNSCPRVQLALGKDRLQVMVDRAYADLEELGHQLLREPDGLALEPALDARSPVLGLVEDQLGPALRGITRARGHGLATEHLRWRIST
jgi:hypothetical protein